MKKIKVKKVRRDTIESLLVYVRHCDVWARNTDTDEESRYAHIMAGSVIYAFALRLFNKIATNRTANHFPLTVDLHEAAALMLYHANMPVPKGKLEQVMINDLMGKIHQQL